MMREYYGGSSAGEGLIREEQQSIVRKIERKQGLGKSVPN
jgi:hypothetical protein